ncbi:hypothetical protein FOBRF1_008124 [Fusarium oxysporum]
MRSDSKSSVRSAPARSLHRPTDGSSISIPFSNSRRFALPQFEDWTREASSVEAKNIGCPSIALHSMHFSSTQSST